MEQEIHPMSSPTERERHSTGNSATSSSPVKERPVSHEELEAAKLAWNKPSRPSLVTSPSPVLPVPGEKNVLITSALPYVNNIPHLGNIIGCVLSADVFARYCRSRHYNTLFICGTDEYGTATETKAIEEGVTPLEICDKYHQLHSEIYRWFQISFNHFGRTSTSKQTEIAQEIFWKLHENGYIFENSLDQLFCESCQRFLADRYVEGTCPFCAYSEARGDQCDQCGRLINTTELLLPRCKLCHEKPVFRNSKHLFMNLPEIEPKLNSWFRSSSSGWTHHASSISRSWLKDGLKARCISRDLKWGVPIPKENYTEKVFYVWFDAPIGYLSITASYTDQWQQWWKNPDNVTHYEFMAKDNVPFHGIIFPCTLLGTGDNYTMVNHLMSVEYLNYEDEKFSKSREVGVFGSDARETGIPADIWRFYLLFIRPESHDSSFSWSDLQQKNNSELLNNLGNFINRALMFVEKFFASQIPEMSLRDEDYMLLALITRELGGYISLMEKAILRDGITHILTISRLGNQYMQSNQPWVLAKGNEQEKQRAGTVVGLCANICCLLSILLSPYMPRISKTIQWQLNLDDQDKVDVGGTNSLGIISDVVVQLISPNHRINKPSPLFQKIENSTIEDLKKRFSAGKSSKSAEANAKQLSKTTSTAGDHVITTNGLLTTEVDCEVIKTIQNEIVKQGEIVRKCKTEQAEKAMLDVEILKLVELKKKLAISEGKDPSAYLGGSGGKKRTPKAEVKTEKGGGPKRGKEKAPADNQTRVDLKNTS